MKLKCKDSYVEWFTPGYEYSFNQIKHDENRAAGIVSCSVGTEWDCIESQYTPGLFTAYNQMGRCMALLYNDKYQQAA